MSLVSEDFRFFDVVGVGVETAENALSNEFIDEIFHCVSAIDW